MCLACHVSLITATIDITGDVHANDIGICCTVCTQYGRLRPDIHVRVTLNLGGITATEDFTDGTKLVVPFV